MTKIAIVFPGQGSQFVGMGRALFDNFSEAKQVFQEADDALNFKLSELVFNGPEEKLVLTENTQPALLVTSLAVFAVLKAKTGAKNIADLASFVAGHSLGEYTALTAAEVMSLADAVRLVRLRGQAMQSAVPAGEGAMAALLGVTIEEAKAIAEQASSPGQLCQIANDNSNGQVVISGASTAIDRAVQLAKKAIKLAVSAPFHSYLMKPVEEKMRAALDMVKFNAPLVPIITNITTQAESDPQKLKNLLIEQICGTVRWRESVLAMKTFGVSRIVEVGPGKVLTGLTKRIDDSFTSMSLQNLEDIEGYI